MLFHTSRHYQCSEILRLRDQIEAMHPAQVERRLEEATHDLRQETEEWKAKYGKSLLDLEKLKEAHIVDLANKLKEARKEIRQEERDEAKAETLARMNELEAEAEKLRLENKALRDEREDLIW